MKLVIAIVLILIKNCMPIDDIIINPKKVPLKGALIEDYHKEVLMIKLQLPSQIMRNSLTQIKFDHLPENLQNSYMNALNNAATMADEKFNWLIESFVESLPMTTQIEEELPNPAISIKHSTRVRRSPLRFFMALLRLSRPLARVAPNVARAGRYAKFLKGLKYTGYAASAAVISFEIADAFGIVPDQKYEELKQAMIELSLNQQKDMEFMGNITLSTMKLNENINSKISQLRSIMLDSRSSTEMYVRSSTALNNYIDQIQLSLILLLKNRLSSNIMNLDSQTNWLENKLPTYLSKYIGTITPTFPVEISGYDFKDNILFVTVDIPSPSIRFQLLNFVQWEPKIKIAGKCFTSPEPFYYLAYPTTTPQDSSIITNPYIFDSRSCLNEGFILCESDSLLPMIPELKFDAICSSQGKTLLKRSINDNNKTPLVFSPGYNITKIIMNSISPNNLSGTPGNDDDEIAATWVQLHQSIMDEKTRRENQLSKIMNKLEGAEHETKIIRTVLIVSLTTLFILAPVSGYMIYKCILKKQQRFASIRDALSHQLNEIA